MKLLNLLAKGLAVAGLIGASVAGATVYTWSGSETTTWAYGGVGGSSDPLKSFTTWYDDKTQNLGVTATWTVNSADGAPEGAWLVLSDGAMPKAMPGEVPIYYIDWKTGTNRITSYAYDGSVADGGGAYFGSVDNKVSFSQTGATAQMSFVLNLAAQNAYTGSWAWKGGDFASNVGVWFHWFDQTAANKITYTSAGNGQYKIANVGTANESWYDTGGNGNGTTSCSTVPGTPGYSASCAPAGDKPCGTTGGAVGTGTGGTSGGTSGGSGGCGKVPVPTVPLLLGVGLLGLGLSRRALFAK